MIPYVFDTGDGIRLEFDHEDGTGTYVELEELFNKGVVFISLSDNIDLSTATGKLQFQILSAFAEFFNLTYTGLDHRMQTTYERIKELSGKCDGEIISKGFPQEYYGWAIQEQVWKHTGLNKETFKKRLKWLKNEKYIESHYDLKQTSVLRVGTEAGKESVIGVTIPTCKDLLTHWNTPLIRNTIYKGKEKIAKKLFSLKEKRDVVTKIPTSNLPTYKTENISSNSNEEVVEEFIGFPSSASSFNPLEGDEGVKNPHSPPLSSSSFSTSEILDFIKSFDGRTTEQVITKFGDGAENVLTKMKSQGDLFEHKPGFWKILE